MQQRFTEIDKRVFLIDTLFALPERVAAYLLVEPGVGAALVDCGGTKSIPHMLAALEQHQVAREQVLYVLPTHVHIDHAGGVGELLKFLPNAKVLAHENAVKHLLNPEKLMQSTITVYGQEAVDNHIGYMLPVAPERISGVADYESIFLGERELQFIDAPGHAYHHYALWDKATNTVIAGDVYGNSYSSCAGELGYAFSTPAVPTQFDPPVWRQSLHKLAKLEAGYVAVAHFGIYSDSASIIEQLDAQLHYIETFAQTMDLAASDLPEQVSNKLYDYYRELWNEKRCYQDVSEVLRDSRDLRMVIDGIVYWLRKYATKLK